MVSLGWCRSWVPVVVVLASGCGKVELAPVELETEPQAENQLQLTENKDVDILFVIDNSGSMGAEQANLVSNFGVFVEILEANDVDANYRIAITTTDNGNHWCGETTPEAGALVLSSCESRIGDFVFDFGQQDVSELACTDVCELDESALEILPSATDVDAEFEPRPWLQRIEGHKNIPAGTSTVDAFRCFGPQGINGCGFESPLESMHLALSRFDAPDEPSYGFMRDSALLAVVFVTDEVDCSYNKAYSGVFTGEQGKVFWSDPDATVPNSALCWNAGTECVGDPSSYDDCTAVDLGIDGQPAGTPQEDHAVLHPLSRYLDRLDAIEQDKRTLNASAEVIVGLIGGVQPDGSVVYADAGDLEFQADHGIGPGCTGPLGEAAVPPVRLREFTNAYTPDNLHSICATDYSGALTTIADRIRTKIIPACYGRCVADIDPMTEVIEAKCEVEQEVPGIGTRAVPECLRDAQGSYAIDPASGSYVMPSATDEVCFATRTDLGDQSPDTLDDIAAYCTDRGYNLEFQLAYAAGVVPPREAFSAASCVVSPEPELDCPNL